MRAERLVRVCELCCGPGVTYDKVNKVIINPCPKCKGTGSGTR